MYEVAKKKLSKEYSMVMNYAIKNDITKKGVSFINEKRNKKNCRYEKYIRLRINDY
jgi:hypothetical protein